MRFIRVIALAVVTAGVGAFAQSGTQPPARKQLLVIGEEKGYRHEAVTPRHGHD